jgi:hypothetical protein
VAQRATHRLNGRPPKQRKARRRNGPKSISVEANRAAGPETGIKGGSP